MIPTVLRNQLVLLAVLVAADVLDLLPAVSTARLTLPVLTRCAAALVGFGYVHDVLMYAGHRYVLHSRWGFKRFHALHHATRGSVAASALYMGTVDLLLEIAVPFLGWFVLVGVEHVLVVLGVVAVGGWLSMYEHSGWQFAPGVDGLDTRKHAAHHRALGTAYAEGIGSPGLCDRVMGTSWAGGAGGAGAGDRTTPVASSRQRQKD